MNFKKWLCDNINIFKVILFHLRKNSTFVNDSENFRKAKVWLNTIARSLSQKDSNGKKSMKWESLFSFINSSSLLF